MTEEKLCARAAQTVLVLCVLISCLPLLKSVYHVVDATMSDAELYAAVIDIETTGLHNRFFGKPGTPDHLKLLQTFSMKPQPEQDAFTRAGLTGNEAPNRITCFSYLKVIFDGNGDTIWAHTGSVQLEQDLQLDVTEAQEADKTVTVPQVLADPNKCPRYTASKKLIETLVKNAKILIGYCVRLDLRFLQNVCGLDSQKLWEKTIDLYKVCPKNCGLGKFMTDMVGSEETKNGDGEEAIELAIVKKDFVSLRIYCEQDVNLVWIALAAKTWDIPNQGKMTPEDALQQAYAGQIPVLDMFRLIPGFASRTPLNSHCTGLDGSYSDDDTGDVEPVGGSGGGGGGGGSGGGGRGASCTCAWCACRDCTEYSPQRPR